VRVATVALMHTKEREEACDAAEAVAVMVADVAGGGGWQ